MNLQISQNFGILEASHVACGLRGLPHCGSLLPEIRRAERRVSKHLLLPFYIKFGTYDGSLLLQGESEMHVPEAKDWHFDVDKYLKSYIPRNLVNRLPKLLSHFLGHRNKPRTEIGNIIVAGWALLGAFVGVATIEAAFMAPTIKDHEVPLLIGSFVRFVLRILLAESMLTYTGCCCNFGIQYHRITARPASEHYNRTHLICCGWRWHHQAL